MKRWQYVSIIIIALIGVVIAAELTNLHLKVIADPSFDSFCNISDKVNCDKVNSSNYSEILSIPISHLGFLTYLLIIIVAFFSLRGHPLSNLLSTANLFIFVFCNVYSVILLYISLAIIQSFCVLCCGLYIVNLLLLIVAIFNIKDYFTLNIACPLRAHRGFAISVITFVIFALVSTIVLRNITISEREKSRRTTEERKQIVIKDIDISGSFSFGPENAPVTVVEVTDFECPFCRKAYPIVKDAVSRYKDKIRFVLKNFPLGTECNSMLRADMHPRACKAAYAAVCAGEQNRFFEYADKLMSGELDRDAYIKYAKELDLDLNKFTSCLDSNTTRQSVARDLDSCAKCQIMSVPTVFINGRVVIGAKPLQEYIITIEEELKKANRR